MDEPSAQGGSEWNSTARQAVAEAARMLQLRRDLARLELRHDRALVKWFLYFGGGAALLLVCGLPLLLAAAALALARTTPWSADVWLCIFGAVLVFPGLIGLVLSVRRLRAEFCGLRSTWAELHEDLVWIRDWAHQENDHPWGAR